MPLLDVFFQVLKEGRPNEAVGLDVLFLPGNPLVSQREQFVAPRCLADHRLRRS